jgi:hypothetical protein
MCRLAVAQLVVIEKGVIDRIGLNRLTEQTDRAPPSCLLPGKGVPQPGETRPFPSTVPSAVMAGGTLSVRGADPPFGLYQGLAKSMQLGVDVSRF